MQVPIFNMAFQKTIFTQSSLHHFNHPFNFPINPYMVSWSCVNINWWLFILLLKFHTKFLTLVGEHLAWSVKLLNRGIRQLCYCQGKRLLNKNMSSIYLLSCCSYCHATTIVMHISSSTNLKKNLQLFTNLW
jgi:hypothetical protein